MLIVGDTAAKGRLQAGDEILRVNDYSFENVTHFDAWNYLKKLPDGLVRVVVRRRLTTELDHDYRWMNNCSARNVNSCWQTIYINNRWTRLTQVVSTKSVNSVQWINI